MVAVIWILSRSGIEILPEVMRDLKEAGLEKKIDVFVDGGIRRGTDIIKCSSRAKLLALGSRRFIQCPHMVRKFNDVCKY